MEDQKYRLGLLHSGCIVRAARLVFNLYRNPSVPPQFRCDYNVSAAEFSVQHTNADPNHPGTRSFLAFNARQKFTVFLRHGTRFIYVTRSFRLADSGIDNLAGTAHFECMHRIQSAARFLQISAVQKISNIKKIIS